MNYINFNKQEFHIKRKGNENNTPKVGSVTESRRGCKTNQGSGYSDG